jgi:hypothetical protein
VILFTQSKQAALKWRKEAPGVFLRMWSNIWTRQYNDLIIYLEKSY